MKVSFLLLAGLAASLFYPIADYAQEPPPPPAVDYSPKRWKEFSSGEGGFKVLLPGTPKESITTQQSPLGDIVIHAYRFKGVISQDVMYADYPASVEEPSYAKKFFDDIRDGGLANVAKANPRIVKETDFLIDGHPGRFLQLELSGNSVIRMKLIAVKNRVYTLLASSGKANPGVMGSENDYEEIAMAFLDSFQLAKR